MHPRPAEGPQNDVRFDPLRRRWVVVAADRRHRPRDVGGPAGRAHCPFEPGREAMTPPETFALARVARLPDTPGWDVRVVPNKFPALTPGAVAPAVADSCFTRRAAVGVHEVIIESADHGREWPDMAVGELVDVLSVWRARLAAAARLPEVKHVIVFKNRGALAGASLEHPHSQLVAGPVVPPIIAAEVRSCRGHWRTAGSCPFCDLAESEVRAAHRVVAEVDGFVAFAHPAAAFAHETWVMPIAHAADFASARDRDLHALARLLGALLAALRDALGDPAYNLILHTAPQRRPGAEDDARYHWHLELVPRLGTIAGFELGSGITINHVPPEESAARLRNAWPGRS